MSLAYIGNTASSIIIQGTSESPQEVSLRSNIHKKPVTLLCETYKELVLVEKKDFTSEITKNSNKFTFKFDPSFDMVVCPAKDVTYDSIDLYSPLPEGRSVSYKLYKEFGSEGKPGGVVFSFKADRYNDPTEPIFLQVLNPFAKFVSKDEQPGKCVIIPEIERFEATQYDSQYLSVYGVFKANQEYVVTCPNTKVVVYADGPKTLISASYFGDTQEDPKEIVFEETSAASFTTILGSIIIVASALAVLF